MNKKQMVKEVRKLEEFEKYNNKEINNISKIELGAILGFWNIGDGGEVQ